MDKFLKKYEINNKSIVFFIIVFLISIIAGSIFSIIINSNDKLIVTNYLSDFFSDLTINITTFKSNSLFNFIYITIIWLLGFSIIGIPILLLFYFIKSFIIGFSLGSIILNYKFKGIILSILYFFPHTLINTIIYTILIISSLKMSFKLLDSILLRKNLDFKNCLTKYSIIYLFSIGVIIISILYEYFLLPKIYDIFI